MIDSLLLSAARVLTFEGQRPLTNASGFFFERGRRLFLVTSRHVVVDEPSEHFPDRIEIELHTDEKNLAKEFKKIDLDGDGFLDPGEIRLAIKNVAPQITEMEISLMLATSDKDQDGKITFEEWANVMLHDHENDVPYWEKYGERDMMVGLKDRRKIGGGPKGK